MKDPKQQVLYFVDIYNKTKEIIDSLDDSSRGFKETEELLLLKLHLENRIMTPLKNNSTIQGQHFEQIEKQIEMNKAFIERYENNKRINNDSSAMDSIRNEMLNSSSESKNYEDDLKKQLSLLIEENQELKKENKLLKNEIQSLKQDDTNKESLVMDNAMSDSHRWGNEKKESQNQVRKNR